jgi:predicted negative regulator of RcsB-dependent stress response
MTRRITRKEMKTDEFVETAVEASHWLEENWPLVAKAAAAILVLGAIIGIGFWSMSRSRAKAEAILSQGIQQYQQAELSGFSDPADLEAALTLFQEASGRTAAGAAGRSARYFEGATLLRLDRAEEAAKVLDDLVVEELEPTLAVSSNVLLAEALAGVGQSERAISLLETVAGTPDSLYPPDQALLLLARIHMQQGDKARARDTWQRIAEQYPQSAGAVEATRLLATP